MFPTGKEDPFGVFGDWLHAAKQTDLREPTACALATADGEGRPSSRMVLLKEFDERGFVFFTNKKSRKGGQLKQTPFAALCFYWDILGKQVRVSGKIEEVGEHESDAYFASRQRGSQIGAWASMQSKELDDYTTLEKRVSEMTEQFGDGPVPRPPHWGGYRIIPDRIEFWLHMDCRLHKRMLYERDGESWKTSFLYP